MKKKKRAFTLLEIMIAILIITLITGAIGYNMRGTLEKGKAFRTRQGQEQLHDLLMMCAAETGAKLTEIKKNPEQYLKQSGLAKDPGKLLMDGWGVQYEMIVEGNDLEVRSKALSDYENKHQ